MYRQYENICVLENLLEEAKARLAKAKAVFGGDADELIDIEEEVLSLEERLNFAWQDDEASEFGYDY